MAKLYREIASTLDAYLRCAETLNEESHKPGSVHPTMLELRKEWHAKHAERIYDLVREHMPRGSGVDEGVKIDLWAMTNPERLVFSLSYHHMNGHGFYDGWSDHSVIVKPSLIHEIDVRITGQNRNDIKEYLTELFTNALMKEV